MKWSPSKSSARPTRYVVIMVSLPVYPWGPWHPHDCFGHWQFSRLTISPFSPRYPPPVWQSSECSPLSVSLFLLCSFCFLDSTCKWNPMTLSLSVWLPSPSMVLSRPVRAVAGVRVPFTARVLLPLAFACAVCSAQNFLFLWFTWKTTGLWAS